jgi:uncharacterized DUF497 family protein
MDKALPEPLSFEWDEAKAAANLEKHGVSFEEAQKAFLDRRRLLYRDLDHSEKEDRFFCVGMVEGEVITVRYTLRGKQIRIYGAGYWRTGRRLYEKESGL